jgi:hypothetical protein
MPIPLLAYFSPKKYNFLSLPESRELKNSAKGGYQMSEEQNE